MTTTRIIIPPPLVSATQALTPLVTRYKDTENCRLLLFHEVVGGVSMFKDVQIMLDGYEHWDDASSPEWEDLHEYYYDVGGRGVCTTVDMNTHVSVSHMEKSNLQIVLMEVYGGHGDARAVLTEESPLDDVSLPEMVIPSKVCIRRRLVYRKAPWQVELVCMWVGRSRSDAEVEQSKNNTGYRLVVEFTPTDTYWQEVHHTSEYVSASMLMKLLSVVCGDMVRVNVQEEESLK